MPPFTSRKGCWRPDFLLRTTDQESSERNPDEGMSPTPSPVQSLQICEINARFAFNGFFSTAFAHEAYLKKPLKSLGLKLPVDPEKVCTTSPLLLSYRNTQRLMSL